MDNYSKPKRSSSLVHFNEPILSTIPGNHRAVCKYCSTAVCGSIKATSNFKRHLQVSYCLVQLLFWNPSRWYYAIDMIWYNQCRGHHSRKCIAQSQINKNVMHYLRILLILYSSGSQTSYAAYHHRKYLSPQVPPLWQML
jgi:hypothetical protein